MFGNESTRIFSQNQLKLCLKTSELSLPWKLYPRLQLPFFAYLSFQWRLFFSIKSANLIFLPSHSTHFPMNSELQYGVIMVEISISHLVRFFRKNLTPEKVHEFWQNENAYLPAFVAEIIAWQAQPFLFADRYDGRICKDFSFLSWLYQEMEEVTLQTKAVEFSMSVFPYRLNFLASSEWFRSFGVEIQF